MTQAQLTVIVAPVDDGSAIPGFLDALRAQEDAPPLEIVIPYDASVVGVDTLRRDYPEVTLLEVEGTSEDALSGRIGRAHLAIDRRRAAAMRRATAPLIAISDEHGRPDARWARAIVEAHATQRNAVIGGAVLNVRPRVVNWGLFFMDAGRYQNPLPEGPAAFVTDVNVSYKREALAHVEDVWREVYMETDLHDALAARGETHLLRRDIVMGIDRGRITLRHALAERFAWSRLFAARRSAHVGRGRRLVWALGAPLLGPLLALRQARLALSRGRHRGAWLRCLPVLLLMDLVWSVGEMTGYATGRGT